MQTIMNTKSKEFQSVNNYFYYMWNQWNKDRCVAIFGSNLGEHIWNKWIGFVEDYGSTNAVAGFWADIDYDCREKIVEAANYYYNN